MQAASIATFIPWIGIDDVPGPRWQEAVFLGSLA
jgi:hypothetical protein